MTVFGDGSQTRSFCYVSDLVDGLYRLAMSDERYPVNVGNPLEMTIREFAEQIQKLFGGTSSIEYRPLPEDDPKRRRPDITKAKTLLGWEPKVVVRRRPPGNDRVLQTGASSTGIKLVFSAIVAHYAENFRSPIASAGLCCISGSSARAGEVRLIGGQSPEAGGFSNSKVMDHLFYLTDVYGPRLTNSPGYMQAADWAVKRLKGYGLKNAHLEKWGPFGQSWTYTKFAAHMTAPQYQPLIGFPLAWTPGTNGPVSGEPVLAVMTRDTKLDKYKGKLKGKIVMIDLAARYRRRTKPCRAVIARPT